MKIHLLRLGSVALLMSALGAFCLAAPAPPRLEELPPIKVEAGWYDNSGRTIRLPSHSVHNLTFSPDGKTLYAAMRTHGVWIFDVASRKCVTNFEPRTIGIAGASTAFSPDGKTGACFGGRKIVLWDVESRKVLGVLNEDGVICYAVFSADGKSLSVYLLNNPAPRIPDRLRIWDVEKRKRVRTCLTRDGGVLGQVTADSGVKIPLLDDSLRYPGDPEEKFGFRLVDAFTGQFVLKCEWDKKDGTQPTGIAMNRAEMIVASAGHHTPVQLWDRNSGTRIARFKHCPGICIDLKFSPEGNILACYYRDRDKRPGNHGFVLYEVPSGKVLADVKQPEGLHVWAFSPDGRLLAVEHDMEIRLWRIPEKWRRKR